MSTICGETNWPISKQNLNSNTNPNISELNPSGSCAFAVIGTKFKAKSEQFARGLNTRVKGGGGGGLVTKSNLYIYLIVDGS